MFPAHDELSPSWDAFLEFSVEDTDNYNRDDVFTGAPSFVVSTSFFLKVRKP